MHVVVKLLRPSGVMAQDDIPLGAGCDKEQVGHKAAGYNQPNSQTEKACKARTSPAYCPKWVADAQVPVHTDTGEEKDTAVEVPIEKEADELAETSAKGPMVAGCIIVDEGGQRQHIQSV